ncbi:MAG: SH3 domain-containing protein [Firmicutes bacterium]|nr:SH3 domain-containing protein [Bacillota bacterium]
MKKIIVSLLLLVLSFTTATALAETPFFTDIENAWAKEAILQAVSEGIFAGNPDGTFAPKRAINRGEFALVVTRALDLPLETMSALSFKDAWQIPDWAQAAVATMVREGIMQGRGDGTFGPLTPVTREEAAVVLVRSLDLTKEAESFRSQPGFADDRNISPWALGFVALAREKGLFSGDSQNRFHPQQPLLRGEAAPVMLKCVELAKNNNGQGPTENSSTGLRAITTSNLNLRTEPNTESTIIVTLPQGTGVSVLAVENVNGEAWLKVQYQGRKGYVSAAYTTLTSTSPPQEADKPRQDNVQDSLLLAKTTANLNVRTSPGINSPRVGQLARGTEITVEDMVQHMGETWLEILYQGQRAYISGEYTDIVTIPQAPRGESGEGQGTNGQGSHLGNDLVGDKGKESGGQTASGSQPPTVPPGEIQYRPIDDGTSWGLRMVVPGKKVTVATLQANLNVREAPREDSPRLGGLPAGTMVPVQQVIKTGDKEWLKISFQGKNAYLAAWYTSLSQETQDVAAPGVNEITLSRVNESLYSLLIKGSHPLGGKLRSDSGQITLEIPLMDALKVERPLTSKAFSHLNIAGKTITLKHRLQKVDARLRATGDGGLQVLLNIDPDDPILEGAADPAPKGVLRGKVIMLDAGHGGTDPGAIGPSYGTKEKDVVLPITLKTAALLEAHGARVILTRGQDKNVSLESRVNLSNSHRPHLFVSIHADYNYNPATNGSTVYYSSANPRSQESYNLGMLIMDELAKNPGLRRVGVRDSKYYVLRNNAVPAVLVETAFLSYAPEEALLRQDSFQQRVAEGITAGILRYCQ